MSQIDITTYLLEKLKKNIVSLQIHSEIGLIKEKLNLLDPKALDDSIVQEILNVFLKEVLQPQENDLYMQELVANIKNMTSNDKLTLLNLFIHMMKLSKISVQDSIGTDKDLKPFWNKFTREMSMKLLLPIKTECVDLDMNLLNGFVKNQTLKSWFSIQIQKIAHQNQNYQKIYYQLLQCLLQKIMESELPKIDKKERNLITCRKIRIYPNKEQTSKLKQWFGIYRYIYNKGLEKYNNSEHKNSHKSRLQYYRDTCVKNMNYENENEWVNDLPADTRDYAIKELLRNIDTNFKKGSKFKMMFKNRKQHQSIEIRTRQYNTKRGTYSFLKNIKLTEKIPIMNYDIKVCMQDNMFYFCIPIDIERNENQISNKSISLDPGIRTFLTGYDTNGYIINIGTNDIGKFCRLNHFKNKLQSKIKKTKENKKKLKLIKAYKRIGVKIKNLRNDAHNKIIKWLLQNYKYIILPKLNTNSFCKKKMSKRVKNKIKSWCHCKFYEKLVLKQREYPTSYIISAKEEYTSKTCCKCGLINDNLGSSKIYKCNRCGIEYDRDANASLNILLKRISEFLKMRINK